MHPEGAHMYPFSFTLNPNLPSSFEGSRGYIRYTCKATIDRPWKFDQSSKRAFTMPIIAEREETMQGCCCDAGKLGVSLHLNKSGYVPGEPIVYDITIHNNTDTTITSVTLTLRQIVKYTGFSDSLFSSGNPKYHTKTQDISLFGHAVNIGQNSTHSINRATLVPSLPPSHLEGCNIIDIDYIIILKIPCSWSSLKIERGIIIAPPSYEECVFGKVNVRDENDDEHTSGQMAWAPAYPFYDWSQHSSQTYGGFAPDVARPAPPDYNQI
ncbi:hypothetical protein KUTeg_018815 [Tegillarca granosa]|uniref:Arrestin C-terminal-like domain-containing protein n=1 Tax=Tegillarca granosa TaxID=220873 RepID=A0ABQ9EAP7_TEGGR|nr:hypothetical protein KUTeg_018815 [Tegillarca granosa]